jgi:hypothetical protein
MTWSTSITRMVWRAAVDPTITWTVRITTGGGGASLSDATPQPAGTATAGVGTVASRDDHRHAMPTASDVGAAAAAHAASHRAGGSDALWRQLTFSNADYNLGTAPAPALSTNVVLAQTGTLAAARTVTLPAASSLAAGTEVIVQAGAGCSAVNTVSIARAGSDTINGAAPSVVMTAAYAWRRFVTDGASAWTFDAGIVRQSDIGTLVQPADSDLTTIAGLTATTDSFIQAKSGAWSARTVAQVKTDLGVSVTPALYLTTPVGDYVGASSPNVAAQTAASMALSATGRSNAAPLWIPAGTYDQIGVIVSTGGTATIRLGLYAASATTGYPTGTPVIDAGTVSTVGTGLQQIGISLTLPAGWYWAVAMCTAYTSTFELAGFSDSTAPFLPGAASASTSPGRQRVARSQDGLGTGSLPASWVGNAWQVAAPKVILRRSA